MSKNKARGSKVSPFVHMDDFWNPEHPDWTETSHSHHISPPTPNAREIEAMFREMESNYSTPITPLQPLELDERRFNWRNFAFYGLAFTGLVLSQTAIALAVQSLR